MTPAASRRVLLFGAIGVLCLIANLAANLAQDRGRFLRGDARRFYLYLPSVTLDHDLQLADDQYAIDTMERKVPEEVAPRSGTIPNLATIGAAIAWFPFFIAALLLQAIARALAGTAPVWDGYSLWMQSSIIAAGVFYAVAAAWITANIVDRWFARTVSTASTLLVWVATPALYYTLVSPAYSHSVGWFSVALAVALWLRARDAPGTTPWLVAGIAFGYAAMVRPQDALLLAIPIADLAWPSKVPHAAWRERAVRLTLLGSGSILGFLPQMATWMALYGSAFANPLGESPAWLQPRLWESFFGLGVYGLFTWAPITLVGVIGMALFARREVALGVAMLGVILLAGYVQASAPVLIETGTSFGPRRFVSYAPLFAVGVAAMGSQLLISHPRAVQLAAAVLAVWNCLLIVSYQWLVRVHGEYPDLGQLLRFWVSATR